MSIQTEVIKKYDDGRVQVKISKRNSPPHFYKVPEENADIFQQEYQKRCKKNVRTTTIVTLIATFAGSAILNPFTKKVKTEWLGGLLNALGSLVFGMGAAYGILPAQIKKNKEIFNKYGAERIKPDENKFPV